MKTLEGLQEKILDVRGKPVVDGAGEALTIGDALINVMATSQQSEGKKILRAMRVAEKLFASPNNHVELEDAEYDLLKETVLAQGPRVYAVTAMAPLLTLLGEKLD